MITVILLTILTSITILYIHNIAFIIILAYLWYRNIQNEKTYRLSYSTKKAYNAANLMYNNATVYLERKYNIYLDMCHHKSGKNGEP